METNVCHVVVMIRNCNSILVVELVEIVHEYDIKYKFTVQLWKYFCLLVRLMT